LRRIGRSSFLRAISIGVALSLTGPAMARSAAAPPSGFDNPEAEELYLEGVGMFEANDFEGALQKAEASLELERTANSLYVKAQSLNRLDRCREAVPAYSEALALVPANGEAGTVIRGALAKCAEKMVGEDEAAVTPPVLVGSGSGDGSGLGEASDPADEPSPKSSGKKWYADPYAPVLIGVGAIGVGIGGYYLGQASEENAKQPEQYDEFAAKGERVRQLQVQGGVILGVGAALVLTGAIRYTVLGVRGRKSRTAFTPLVSPRLTGASLSGRF